MAIYHLHATTIGRRKGRSVTAAAAYRSGSRIVDSRTGEVHDYSRRRDVAGGVILAPEGAPLWARDRVALWNSVEFVERRSDARLAREIVVAIPRELKPDAQRRLVLDFVGACFTASGMVADVAFHGSGGGNPHAHILLTTRSLGQDGFGKKVRDWDAVERLVEWRRRWAELANHALAAAGADARITHESYAAQGRQVMPTVHVGPKLTVRDRHARPERADTRAGVNAEIRRINKSNLILSLQPRKSSPTLARAVATHYERQTRQFERTRDVGAIERRLALGRLSTERVLEGLRGYERRRQDLEAARAGERAQRLREGRDRDLLAEAVRIAEAAKRPAAAAEKALRDFADRVRPRVAALVDRENAALTRIEAEIERYRSICQQRDAWKAGAESSAPLRFRRKPA